MAHRRTTMVWLVAALLVLALSGVSAAKTEIYAWSWEDAIGNWMRDAAGRFNASQDEIHVIVELHPYDGYFDKVKLATAAGIGPEVIRAAVDGMHDPLPADMFAPSLRGYMEEQATRLPFYNEYIGDQIYGLPWVVWPSLLWYNKDHFDEAGIGEPPATWDELLSVARRLTRTDGEQNIIRSGFAMEGKDFAQVFLPQLDPDFYRVGDREVSLVGGGAEDAYNFMLEVIRSGVTNWPQNVWAGAQLTEGSASMMFQGSWYLGHLRNYPDFNWGVAPQPRQSASSPYGLLAVASDLRLGLDVSGEAADAAGVFIRFLMEEENIALVSADSGLLPAQLDYFSSPIITGDPALAKIMDAAAQVLPNSVAWPQGTAFDVVLEGIDSVIYQALDQGTHPLQATHQMEQAINSRLADFYAE